MRHEAVRVWVEGYREAHIMGRVQILYLLSLPLLCVGAAGYLGWVWTVV